MAESDQLVINNFVSSEFDKIEIKDLRSLTKEDIMRNSNQQNQSKDWIQTFSGQRFYPLNPQAETIKIQDIANALSKQCRFSGQISEFYSVAEHSVYVSYLCDQKDALFGLLHDASEAYLVDVPRPLKQSGKFGHYIDAEKVLQEMIYTKYCSFSEEPESVKKADMIMLATEAQQVYPQLRADWQLPAKPSILKLNFFDHKKAKEVFMDRFAELSGI